MRTIEFRGIDEFSDEFIYAPAFFVDSDNNQGYLASGIDRHHCIKKETVQQFTGLLDKAGNKIFEGDIVEDKVGRKWVLKYSERFACFLFHFKGLEKSYQNYMQFTKLQLPLELIGNIHENPELLQVAETNITKG